MHKKNLETKILGN